MDLLLKIAMGFKKESQTLKGRILLESTRRTKSTMWCSGKVQSTCIFENQLEKAVRSFLDTILKCRGRLQRWCSHQNLKFGISREISDDGTLRAIIAVVYSAFLCCDVPGILHWERASSIHSCKFSEASFIPSLGLFPRTLCLEQKRRSMFYEDNNRWIKVLEKGICHCIYCPLNSSLFFIHQIIKQN